MKRSLAIILSVIMVFALIPMATMSVSAATVTTEVNSVTGNDSEDDLIYATIGEAITAVLANSGSSKVVMLDENITITEPIVVTCTTGFTFDLNGHSITYSPDKDGEYYNTPAITYHSTNSSASPVQLSFDTTTTTEDAAVARTDTDGTFVNNSGSKYFVKLEANNDYRLGLTSMALMYGTTHNWYGDISVDGAFNGQSNGRANIYGNIITSSRYSDGGSNYYVYGNIDCGMYSDSTYGSTTVYGYVHQTNATDPYILKNTCTLGKLAIKTTYNGSATDTYKGYYYYADGDQVFSFANGNNNNTLDYSIYVGGDASITAFRTTITADSYTKFNQQVTVDGDLTGSVYMQGSTQYHKKLMFTKQLSVGGTISIDATNYGQLTFTNGIASNYAYSDGTNKYATDATPIEVLDVMFTTVEQATQYDVTIDAGEATKVDEGADFTFPTSTADGFVAYTDGTNYYDAGQTVAVNENMSFTTLAIGALTMSTGAAMRLNNENGIRFYTNVDTAKVDDVKTAGATIEMGTLIAPSDYLTDVELTKALDNSKYLDVVFQFEDGEYFTDTAKDFTGVVGSIVKINKGNEARDFVGRGYVTVTFGDYTKTIYADYAGADITNNTRSIAQIATSLKADTAAYNLLETAQKTIVDEYAAYIG